MMTFLYLLALLLFPLIVIGGTIGIYLGGTTGMWVGGFLGLLASSN